MQAIALHPPRGQVMRMLVGVIALAVGMAIVPALCLPFGLLLPLFACPLIGGKRQWVGVAATAAAPLTALFAGQPTMLAVCLLFTCGAPVAAAILLHPKKAATPIAFVYYLAAYGLAVMAMLLYAYTAVGGNLAEGIAGRVTEIVRASSDEGMMLQRAAMAGFIPLPPGYQAPGAVSYWLDPVLNRQLRLSLNLLLEQGMRQLLPQLIIQTCLLGSVFTTLRVQRLNHACLLVDEKHRERVTLAVIPGFSMLRLPSKGGRALACMGVAGLFCLMSDSAWTWQLGLLLYAGFQGVFQLLGVAVLVGVLTQRKPEAKVAFGALTVALYIVFPTALLMLGFMDSLFHFRESFQSKKEEKS